MVSAYKVQNIRNRKICVCYQLSDQSAIHELVLSQQLASFELSFLSVISI